MNDSIFGRTDKQTREWRDSTFIQDLRGALSLERETWFVFDGPLLSEWVEDLNSVLDDNRLLCLITGERLKIPPWVKFVFECEELKDATPATLTRLFLISMCTGSSASGYVADQKSIADVIVGDQVSITDTVTTSDTVTTNYTSDDKLDESQRLAALRLQQQLSTSRVVFLIGKPGIGKKTICRSINEVELVRSPLEFVGSSGKLLVIEEFEDPRVHEEVRELWETGTVAGTSVNHHVVCAVDRDTPRGARLDRVPRVVVGPLSDVDAILRRLLPDHPLVQEVAAFLYRTFDSFSLSTVALFAKFLDPEKFSEDSCGHLYFICKAVWGKQLPVIKRFIEDRRRMGHSVGHVPGGDLGTFPTDTQHPLVLLESTLLYALARGVNVILTGPRLCGKRQLLARCLGKISRKVTVVEWSRPVELPALEEGGLYVFVLVNNVWPLSSKSVSQRHVRERAIELSLAGIPLALDMRRVVEGAGLVDCLHRGESGSLEPSQVSRSDCDQIYSDQPYAELLGASVTHSPVQVFPNLFKLASFYHAFTRVNGLYQEEYEERRRFLRRGRERIEQFRGTAASLGAAIVEQEAALREKQASLEKCLGDLSRERRDCSVEESTIDRSRREIEEEVRVSHEKKAQVELSLKLAEKQVEDAKQSIAEMNKSHLSEIRSMNNPPEIVRRTIECTYLVLKGGERVPEWGYLQGYLKRDELVSKMARMGGETGPPLSLQCRRLVKETLLSKYTVEKTRNASKTCAVLYQWILSIIKKEEAMEEALPLRREIEEIERRLEDKKEELNRKVKELEGVVGRISEIERWKEELEEEKEGIRGNMENISGDLCILEKILANFAKEEIEWDRVLFKDPLFMLGDPNRVFSELMPLSIDRNTLESEEFSEFRRGSIEVSAGDAGLKKVLGNALYFDRDLIVTDVDGFSLEVYEVLKGAMDCASRSAMDCASRSDMDCTSKGTTLASKDMAYACKDSMAGKDRKTGKIVIQFNGHNPFQEETFELSFTEKFKVERPSPLRELETELIRQLNEENPNLREILRGQVLLEREREQLREEERVRAMYGVLNRSYWELSRVFARELGFGLSFRIFRKAVETVDIGAISTEGLKKFVYKFFTESLPADQQCMTSCDQPTHPFTLSEINKLPLDYVFVTSFNDVLFQLKSLVPIDIEISAGSPLNNKRILALLSEHSSRTVLVKNIHFLPPAQKTGSNRFFYTVEPGLSHPLMAESRIVNCDRTAGLESIYSSLVELFGSEGTAGELVRFHSAVMHLKLDFGIKDLDLCIRNLEFSKEFLIEMVYHSRMAGEEVERVNKVLTG